MPTNTLRCSCGCAADSAVPVFVRAQLYTLDYTVIPARNARNFAKKITQINKFFCPALVSTRSLCVFFDFFVNFRLSMHRFLHFQPYYLRHPRSKLFQIRRPQQQMHKFRPTFQVRSCRLWFFRTIPSFFRKNAGADASSCEIVVFLSVSAEIRRIQCG